MKVSVVTGTWLRRGCRCNARSDWRDFREISLPEPIGLSGHDRLISRRRRRGVARSSSESRIQTTNTRKRIQLNMGLWHGDAVEAKTPLPRRLNATESGVKTA